MREVEVLGAGLHRFGRFPDKSLPDLGREAIKNALDDSGVPFNDIEVAYVGRVLAGMGAGLNVVSEMGRTGIPVINIEMACGSSTSAFREAYLQVANGIYDTALVVGFEKMQRGMLQITEQASYQQVMGLAVMPASYALQAQRYMADHEATPEMFAQAAAGVDKAWAEAGRPGKPRKLSLAYFALGPNARNQADNYLLHYYDWLGDVARQIAAGAAVSTEMVKGYAAAFASAGCDELIFVPTTAAPDQIGLLASAVL